MVYLVGVGGALFLGLGWVLQQRVASQTVESKLVTFRLLLRLMGKPLWWAGIGSMVVGQALNGWALKLGAVALVEPLLSTNLLFAFVIAAVAAHHRPRWHEVGGAALLSAALGVFIAVGNPRAAAHAHARWELIVLAAGIVSLVVVALVAQAKRSGLVRGSVLMATGAGVLYGLQDAATRGALLSFHHYGLATLTLSPWPYILLGAGVFGLLLSQSAFRAARLDYSLPPTTAAEPIVGIGLGVGVLGDQLSISSGALAVQVCCLLAMLAGVVLIGRSPALAPPVRRPLRRTWERLPSGLPRRGSSWMNRPSPRPQPVATAVSVPAERRPRR
jgi:drug/metabolite transporter (DMT)-like permease